ncbi:MAG: extracellular solute-binding protein [Planctomycetota bacterium]
MSRFIPPPTPAPARVATVLALTGFLCASLAFGDERPVLNVVNWSWYIEMDDDLGEDLPAIERSPVLRQFMAEQDCVVNYVELDDEGAMRDYILANPSGVDVINLSVGIISDLAGRGVLAKVDESRIPLREGIRQDVRAAIPPDAWEYTTPYFIGYTGILYRKDLLAGGLRSWQQFLKPAEGQTVGLLNAADSVFGIASLTLGYPMDTVDRAEIRAAGKVVMGLRTSGRLGYLGDDLDAIAKKLNSGELTMALMYSGDGLGYVDEDETGRLDFVVPDEGTDFYIDSWAISARSQNTNLAHAFIDFTLRTEIQVRQAIYLLAQVVTEPSLEDLRLHHQEHPHLRYMAMDAELRRRTSLIHRENGQALTEMWNRIMNP